MSSAEYSCKLLKAIFCMPANSVDPDQTAPHKQKTKQTTIVVIGALRVNSTHQHPSEQKTNLRVDCFSEGEKGNFWELSPVKVYPYTFSCLDTLGDFVCLFSKGDNFCYFLFAFLHTKPLLKRDLFLKEKNNNLFPSYFLLFFFSFQGRLFFRWEAKSVLTVVSLENVSISLKR